jgi:HAD superfamily hydrolase (TIGR01509 family)
MSTAGVLTRLLSSRSLLLDFDGPVCDIFAGYPAPTVASELTASLDRENIDIPPSIRFGDDPLEVLRWAGKNTNRRTVLAVEEALIAAELRAIQTAQPTPYAREAIVSARQAGLLVGIVSNNSREAVTAYLSIHRLGVHVSETIGRAHADPAKMKPNPAPILAAATALGVKPTETVLVGDSLSDITGAKAAGVPVIGYANKGWKTKAFAEANADCVVSSMGEIATELIGATEAR